MARLRTFFILRMFLAGLIVVLFGGTATGFAQGQVNQLGFSVSPATLEFFGCRPEAASEHTVELSIQTPDHSWAIFAQAAVTKTQYAPVLETLFIKGVGEPQAVALMSDPPKKVYEGDRPISALSPIGEVTLVVQPGWELPPGTYPVTLMFAYLPAGAGAEAVPLPQVAVEVVVEPAFTIALGITPEAGLEFEVQGPPGLYPGRNSITVSGKSNLATWFMVLRAEDLTGKKGGVIPRSRLFIPVEKGLNQLEYISLDTEFLMPGAPAGIPVEYQIDAVYLETLLEDAPDLYEGRLFVEALYGN